MQEQLGILFEKIKQQRKTMIYGLSDSQRSYVTALVNESVGRSQLIITPDSSSAGRLCEDLKFFLPDECVLLYPVAEVLPYELTAFSTEITSQRLKVMEKLLLGARTVVVAPIQAVFRKLPPPHIFKEHSFSVAVGEKFDIGAYSERLITMGYERSDMIDGAGQFSIRGGIMDIFSLTAEDPIRIELFDDEIDSIRVFDVMSKRSIEKIESAHIFPAKEIIITPHMAREGKYKIAAELEDRIKLYSRLNMFKYADRLREKVSYHLALLSENSYFEGIDLYISYFYDYIGTIYDYFKGDVLVSIYDPEKVIKASREFSLEQEEVYKHLFEEGHILASQSNVYYSSEDLLFYLSKIASLYYRKLPGKVEVFTVDEEISFSVKTMYPFYGKVDFLINEIKTWEDKGYKVILLSGTKERGTRIREILKENGIDFIYAETYPKKLPRGSIFIIEGSIEKGFEFPDLGLVFISDREIFGKTKRKKTTKIKTEDSVDISTFADLNPGDYVVHVNHGIGKYLGIKTLEIQNNLRDYLSVRYKGGDMLYIPTDQVHLIQKYIGISGEDKAPRLNKLGGTEWARTKSRVKESVKEMAEELIKLYAARKTVEGYAFSPDTPWQKEFEDMFPYEETDDQLKSIMEVKRDMESPKPMDRLICGDVGYGKTEVALRASFKAIMDGKQVGVLVPTTILAQQHYTTFTERFEKFPVNIGLLSRFKTPKEQKDIIQGLKLGTVDIVIGTHRLLQKDIKFKELGLLIIDEEQRFGVAHKERLKKMRQNVDVLTLTATPIPRTLHMALSRIRDMSIIKTPPEDRFPVQTYVLEYNELLVKEAITREMARNGQVYYVYNRVETIEREAARLAELVPEARICVAHGQMNEDELEEVMFNFYKGNYDVLVCTTIIESGIDISNVNTLIVTNSDKLGLSTLYQLRGRVGRSNKIAYAYITYQKDKILTEVAQKRLQAIKEFTEFGAGFKIALRDLEIRGAGNLLGSQQHGHMMAVGYELYCRLLDEAVKEAQGTPIEETIEPTIDFQLSAYIDNAYINRADQKIEFYRKIAGAASIDEIYNIEEEMEDIYGDLPEPTRNLLEIAIIKIMAKQLGIDSIIQKGDNIVFSVGPLPKIKGEALVELAGRFPRRLSFDGSKTIGFIYKAKDLKGHKLLNRVRKLLDELITFNKERVIV